jgi:hypothetical protein
VLGCCVLCVAFFCCVVVLSCCRILSLYVYRISWFQFFRPIQLTSRAGSWFFREKCRETEKSSNDARCAETKEKGRYSLYTNATVEELIVKHYNVLQLRHKSSSTSIIHGCVHIHILLSHSAPNAFCSISHFET